LLGGKPAALEPGPNRVGGFAMIFEIMGGEFRGTRALSLHDRIEFAPETGADFKQILDFNSCIADSCTPSDTRVDSRGCFKLEEMPQDPPNL